MKHLFILLCLVMSMGLASSARAQTPDQLQVSHVTSGGVVGDRILISGRHLQSVTRVLFNGVPVTPTKVDPKGFFVEANVPSQATTGPITLQTGSTRFLTHATFRVLPRSTGISAETQRIIDSDRLPAGTSPGSITTPALASVSTAQARLAATGGTISGLKFSDDNRNRIQDVQTVIGSPVVLFILDVSGSTIDPFAGTTIGDLNGDNSANTRLDAEIGVIERIRTELISRGAVDAQIGIVKFSSAASSVDVNPAVTGVQNFAKVGDDKNTNGISDISDTYPTLRTGGNTNYELALRQAITVVNSVSATQDIKIIFLSDGVPNPTNQVYSDEVATLRSKPNVSLSAIGVGPESTLPPLQIIDPNAKRVTDFANLINFSLEIITPLEKGLTGVTLYLDTNNNGQKDEGEPFQTSSPNDAATSADETGTFSFTGLAAGTYTVREIVPTGYMQTAPADKSYSVTITGTESFTSINFGNVRDEIKPVISEVPASLTVSCAGDVPTASGVTATDNFDPTPLLVVNDTRVDGTCANRYVITRTWTATDQAGNQATASQNITVNDNTAPMLNGVPTQPLVVAAQTGLCSATLTFPTITATDNCSGAVTLTYSVGGSTVTPTSSFSLGVTTVQVVATDLCGNQATGSFVVQVNDVTAPVPNLAQLPLLTKACSLTITNKPTATDNCGGQITATTTDPLLYSIPGSYTITWTYTDASGNTSQQTQGVQISQLQAPVLVTASGGSYPAGVSSLTIAQNTGNVILAVSGCAGGTISWSGGNSTTLAVSTASTGVFSYTATCTSDGCTSPVTTATVSVVTPTLRVYSRDPDNGQLSSNTVKPYLLLQNVGNTPIPYSSITVRYYLTTENNIPLLFQKNYAQIGANNVQLRYVPLATPLQGATGYVEFSFSGAAGSLAPMSTSGPIETQFTKQNYSAFNQLDDYSYVNNGAFTLNPRITAYQNGVIFYGVEPGAAMSSTRQGVTEAEARLQVSVLGNPVSGQTAQVEISGAEGQSVQLELTNLQGRSVHQQRIPQAGAIERVNVPMGNAPGVLLLQVSTLTQRQQIKLLKH